MASSAHPPARALLTAHLDRVASSQRGLLRRLRVESGLLVVLGVALTLVALASTAVLAGPGQAAIVLALAIGPAIPIATIGLWLDRHEPEPAWLLRSFLWGAGVATLLAGVINTVAASVIGSFGAAVLSAPIGEEALKGMALLWVLRRFDEHLNGRLDAVVYALFVGLGFAVVENVEYYLGAWTTDGLAGLAGVVFLRGVLTPFLHPIFSMVMALGIVAGLRRSGAARPGCILLGYGGAVLLHALWNSGLGIVLYVPLGVPLFIWMARRVVRASRDEELRLRAALDEASDRGELPGNVAELVGIGVKAGVWELVRAARDPHDPYHARWQLRHLAWIVACDATAAQVAFDDPRRSTSAMEVQAAAREVLTQQLARCAIVGA